MINRPIGGQGWGVTRANELAGRIGVPRRNFTTRAGGGAGACTETRCDTGGEERRRLRAALTHQPPKPLGSPLLPPARQPVASEKAQRAVTESEPDSICPFVEVLLWQEAAGRENGWCQLQQQQQQLVLQSRAEASAIWRHTHTSRIFRNTHARISVVMMINIWMVVDMSLQW